MISEARKQDLWCAGLLLLACAVFFWRVFLLPGEVMASPYSDVVGQFGYWEEFLQEEVHRTGHLPQYNPYTLAGSPVTGNAQYLEFYPFRVASLLFPVSWTVGFNFFFHAWLLCLFTYGLGKEIGLGVHGRLLAALLVGLNTRYLSFVYAGFSLLLPSVSFIPLAWMGLFRAARGSVREGSCLTGVALALSFMGGWPQMTILCLMSLLALSGGMLALERRWRVGRDLAIFFLSASLLSASLAAVKLIPVALMSEETTRAGGMSLDVSSQYAWTWQNLLGFFSPHLMGSPARDNYWGAPNFWEMGCYMAGTGLILAVLGLCTGRLAQRWVFGAFTALAIAFALGDRLPLFPLLFRWIPGLNHFRGPARVLFFAMMALSILAGVGIDSVAMDAERTRMRRRLLFGSGLVISVLFLAGALTLWRRPGQADPLIRSSSGETFASSDLMRNAGREAMFSAGWFGLPLLLLSLRDRREGRRSWLPGALILCAGLDLFAHGMPYLETWPEETIHPSSEVGAFIAAQGPDPFRVLDITSPATVLPDGVVWRHRIETLNGYDPTNLKMFARAFWLIRGEDLPDVPIWQMRSRSAANATCLNMLNVRFVVSDQTLTQPGLRLIRRFQRVQTYLQFMGARQVPEAFVYENEACLPRVFGASVAAELPEEEVWAALKDQRIDPSREVFIHAGQGIPREAATWKGADPSQTDPVTVQSLARSPGVVRSEVEASAPCWLVISEIAAPGWRGTVDGRRVPLYRANGCLMALRVEPGRHRVAVQYEAPGLVVGALGTLVGVGVLLGLLVGPGLLQSVKDRETRKGAP